MHVNFFKNLAFVLHNAIQIFYNVDRNSKEWYSWQLKVQLLRQELNQK